MSSNETLYALGQGDSAIPLRHLPPYRPATYRPREAFELRAEDLKSRPLGYCVIQSIVDLMEWEYQLLN